MQNNTNNEGLQQQGLHTLAEYTKFKLCKNGAESAETVQVINGALERFPDNPKIQDYYCEYFCRLSYSNEVAITVKALGCHRNVLKLFKEAKTRETAAYRFHGFYNLLINFGATDIPEEKGLGAEEILKYINSEKTCGIIKKGLAIIDKILHFNSDIQNGLHLEMYVNGSVVNPEKYYGKSLKELSAKK